jgi:uncharacterized protein with FMN-binding domain
MQNKTLLKTIIGIVIAGVVVAIVWSLPKKSASVADTTQSPTAVPVTEETNGTTTTASINVNLSTSPYKDGTYSATGSYVSPGGPDNVNVSVTLADGIITDATVTSGANDPTSAHYQGIFIANYKPLVVGKNIDDVVLSKVSGSSLTSGGFNDALTKIKAEASA